VGNFLRDIDNKKFVIVAMDHFTKWVEAEALANIRDVDVKKFIWKNTITRFEIPETPISDNRLQFDSKAFQKYCKDIGIKNQYSTPTYPQSNGLVDETNKAIVSKLKKRLEGVEELPNVI